MSVMRKYILCSVEQFYGRSNLEPTAKSEEAIEDFINNSLILILQGVLQDNSSLEFYTNIHANTKKTIIFYKSHAQDLTQEGAIKLVNIVSINNSAAESLYQVVRQIYSPLLSQGDDVYSSKLMKNLSELESNLRIVTHGNGDRNLNVIMSIDDELNYWTTVEQKKDTNKRDKEAVSTFVELFEDISEEIRLMQSSPLSDMRENAENIGGLLDDTWRLTVLPYPQDRMIHTIDIIGHIICANIQNALSDIDLWKVHGDSKDTEILTQLGDGLKVAQTWTSACKALTETYWPNYTLHLWTGKSYIPTFCVNFQNRLKEILDIRSTHNQLTKLLTKQEQAELRSDHLLEPFQSINVWICNGENKSWNTAVLKLTANLRPAESKIAEKLRPRLHNTSTKQMLYEFMRYRTLLERPTVRRTLNNELEIFVTSLQSMLTSIRSQLDSDEVDVKMSEPPEMSPTVRRVQWAQQMEAKIKDVQMIAEKYLHEFEGSDELLKLATSLQKELKNMYTQLHEEWSRDLQAQVKSGSLQLSLDKPVVEFSPHSRMMVVNYNPKLVWTELEARCMAALGFPPPTAASAIDALSDALKHARALQQVASFHNTLAERMIPSTRPMMLQAALDLSSLVQDQKAVYWNDMEQLAHYTDNLKKAVLTLETQNTYLTSQHIAIRSIVEKLIDTELLAKQTEWKKHIKEIRDIIEKVESNGYKNTDVWRSHWDWQLYKALEFQYVKTLLSLHKHFPYVKVDLVLRGRQVRPAPALFELRAAHCRQLRRLLALPAQPQLAGLAAPQGGANIFADIVTKHSWLGNKAVKQIEEALSNLERSCESWTKKAALACVDDLEALCREHLVEPQDWEVNFKACKAYGQVVAKMNFDDEKIDWIIVGTATLRREFEAQARNLWACLVTSLQTSCRNDAGMLDAFIASLMVMLEDKGLPKNAKELAEISAKQQALQAKMPEMEKLVESLKRKGHMLRTWGGDPSVDSTIKEWLKVREQMLSHQQKFEHQAEIVKSSLTGEWENLNTSLEAWLSRWKQTRSRLEETHGVKFDEMTDRCRSVLEARAHWDKLVADRDDLMKESEKFNMKQELTATWKEGEQVMKECVTLWSVLDEYNKEYTAIAEQEWIVFQKKLHVLDEFVSKWSGQLEPFTVITLFIQQELDKFADMTTLLKYLRGTDFTERHWREVFNLLEIEFKKPDTLLVKDLLDAALNIKKHTKILQKICTTASSEAAVRTALNDLEIWFAGARLTVIYYNDKAKRPTPIVKDYKDILTKIEEQQWIVSMLGPGSSSGAGWEARLGAARALLRAAHHAQRRWLYLEPILSNDEGELGIKFRKVDLTFRQVTRILENDPRLSALLQTRLQSMLDSISEQLVACQSALNQYIDEKRSIFPRLYFLSDDDLLELLGQARAGAEGREAVLQTHLKKLFPGTTGVKLGPGGISITQLCSHYGETFQLDHPVDIDCPVEVWLKNLETEMRSSLKNMTLKCVDINLQEQDPFLLPTQILCLAQNIRFTKQAEKAIATKDLHKLKTNIEQENSYYASAEVEEESERNKRQALILQCAFYLGVIKILIDNHVVSTSDWLWQKQLRFYLLGDKEVVIKMGLSQISYSYEYLGVNTGQFVRTELADECFLILTQALHLGLVGNPFGPAGTGKTESVKALGGLVGRLVLIFNCDEAMDAECMGRLLTGLALCGAWGCFDEFNRLSSETLAAVSHQLNSLLSAMKQPDGKALLNGKQISVSPWAGVAATMNPLGRGYGGRRALPAALQRALRPTALVAPSPAPMAARLLAARGVANADQLALRLHAVFVMASSLLSSQRHYDWGLRALKAAIGSCSALSAQRPARAHQTLRRALTLNTISKLTTDDVQRFEKILSMVFPETPEEEHTTDPLSSALLSSISTLQLVHNKLQVQKCFELYEQLQQRMGVVIVGSPGSGKTTIRKLLKNALTQQGRTIVEYTICPKAMSRNCLLGHIDHDTRQWTDGVISSTALEISNQPEDVWSWVVCDGDIDPEWIEALNSVLDDNRLLTLPSGWRVQFGSNVNFIFETDSLEHASPATISRMGIILLSEETTCAQEVLQTWLQKVEFDNEMAKIALPLLQDVIMKCINWLDTHRSSFVIKLYSITMVKQILTQFEYIAQSMGVSVIRSTPEELVYLALQRSVIGLLKHNAVDDFINVWSGPLGAPPPAPAPSPHWTPPLLLSRRLLRGEAVLRACLHSSDAHLLLLANHATAKNLIAEYVLKDSNSTVITIDCTPILEPADIINELKRHSAVSSGGRAQAGDTRITLLVRSLHRASVDAWGSCAVHSFLLQLIQECGFWCLSGDSGGAQWSCVRPLRVLASASAGASAGASASVNASAGASARAAPASVAVGRLAANMTICTLPEPDDDEILELATHYLEQSINKNIQVKDIADLAGRMLSLYKEVTETFTSENHYKWSVSHLKWCFENVKWYSPSNNVELITALYAEANITFRDRLITEEEKNHFTTISSKHLKINTEPLYFATKLKADGVYTEPIDKKEWYHVTQKVINQCLTEHEYNVFGDCGAETCSELAVLCPAVARTTNGGILVCVGSSGLGRRAAAQIVAASLPATIFCVDHASQYHNQYKNAITSAGEGTRTIILVSDSACNSLILATIEAHCHRSSPGEQQTQQSFDNIKQNLGIVVCLDKDQDNLRQLISNYPLIYNEAHLVWLDQWSKETLHQMPKLIVQRLIKENLSEDNKDHESIPVEGFVHIYSTIEVAWMRAPCRYVNFVKTYYYIVSRKKTALVQRRDMLSSGVEALRRARSEVATLQSEAAKQEAALSDKQAKANHALDQISATVRATTDKKEEMYELKKNIELENKKLQIRKKEIEEELASVEPVVAAARAAVGEIKTEALSEVRSLRAPPDVVRDILEGVLRLMGITDTSWHSMKNFLSKRGVKEDIRCLDASQISSAAVESVQRLLERRGSSFEPAVARRASAAGAPLAAWVSANLAHCAALRRVAPLQDAQRDLARNLQEAEAQLEALSTGLATVDERVAALKAQLGQHTREAATIELSLGTAQTTIAAARQLLDHLAQEYEEWQVDLANISKEISELSVRSLLASAYIVYLPDCTEPQAREYIKKWSSLLGFEDATFSVINFLASTEKQLKWDADGLPLDKSAVKNAILIDQVLESHKCGFTPLIIDPDGDAITWLRNTLSQQQCDFVSQHSEKLQTAVQYAARLGRALVVTAVDLVPPAWRALLAGLLAGLPACPSGAKLGRLLLYSRDVTLPGRLPAYHAARLSVIHFTARLDGLTDQLVHYALQQQNPEVNEKSKEIKLKKATLQKQQYELQENLLRDLSTNCDILHDANLLASLNKTRATSNVISQALEDARGIESALSAACSLYSGSGLCAAGLALAVRGLCGRRPLLALELDAVLVVFVEACRRGGADTKNLNNKEVVKYMTRRIIERVLIALHRKDKYIVVLHLLKQVYDEIMPDSLWQILLGNYDIDDRQQVQELRNNYPWIPEASLKALVQIKTTNEDLFTRLSLNKEEFWLLFLRGGDLSSLQKLPLSPFETVALVAALRPATLYRAIVAFVDHILGAGCMSAPALAGGAGGGSPRRPRLLLAAHGADVLAASRNITQVGIEEGPVAWEAAVEQNKHGGWVALIVGASAFTQELQTFISTFNQRPAEDFDDDFRLWIVSEDREIPPLISNACVNVILEAPMGVKHNVLGSLSSWAGYAAPEPRVARLLAGLALAHAVLQERRAYIPQGWSKWYAWEWGDISSCAAIIKSCNGNPQTCKALTEALYTARVDVNADRLLLKTLLASCLGEQALAHSWKPRGTDLQLPFVKEIQAYLSAFHALPDIDSPQLLGLPDNCRVAWEKNAASDIITGLKELNSTVIENRNENAKAPVKLLQSLWKKLMLGSPLIKGDQNYDKTGSVWRGWWGCVVCGEGAAARRLAGGVHAALGRGGVVTQVPDEWQMQWLGPDDPAAYIKEFCFRANAAVNRIKTCPKNEDYMPTEIDLRSFLNVERVMWALRVQTASRLSCNVTDLGLSLRWDKGDVAILGLTLTGGACLGNAVSAAKDFELANDQAKMYLSVQLQDKENLLQPDTTIEIPVYSNEKREHVVFNARVPLARDFTKESAILNAVAMFITPVY